MTAPLPPDPPSLDLSGLQSSLSELGNSLASMTSRLNAMDLAGTLESKIESTSARLEAATRSGFTNTRKFGDELSALSARARENAELLQAKFRELQAESIKPDNAAGIAAAGDAFKKASEAGLELGIDFNKVSNKLGAVLGDFAKLRAENEKLLKSMNQSPMDMIVNKLADGDEDKARILGAVIGKITAVFAEIGKIAMQGLQRATELGIAAAEGVGLELKNRAAAFGTMFTFDASKMVTPEQINATQTAFMSTFAGLRAGTELSSAGMAAFAGELKTGFKSEFQLTGQSMRDLATIGASSAEDFDKFRQASGRASLSSSQFSAIVGKNSLSFLLFGNSFAKAAADAERLGISLAGIQRGQESYVTNLDGAIDTIAQLNQMGAQVDFGTLTQLAEFGTPEEVAKYIAATVPSDMMNSASMRSLFGQLMPGMDSETLLRMAKTGSALDEMESKITDEAKGTKALTDGLAAAAQATKILNGTFSGLIAATVAATIALTRFAFRAGATPTTPNTTGTTGTPTTPSTMGGKIKGGAKFGAGVGLGAGLMSGVAEYQDSGDIGKAVGRGSANLIGATLGGMLGSLVPVFGTALGSMAGAYAGNLLYDKVFADDMVSRPGYGSRTLGTPSGNYALNNDDTVIAGTDLFPEGFLSARSMVTPTPSNEATIKAGTDLFSKEPAPPQRDDSQLIRKVDQLITALQNANTTIQVNGQTQSVSRLQLVGVYTRNEIT